MTTKFVRRKGAVHVTYVSSNTKAGVEYQLARLPDDKLVCACMGFAIHKTCSHAKAFLGAVMKANPPTERDFIKRSLPIPETLPSVTVGAETFTFRRGIVFDAADIPTGRTP